MKIEGHGGSGDLVADIQEKVQKYIARTALHLRLGVPFADIEVTKLTPQPEKKQYLADYIVDGKLSQAAISDKEMATTEPIAEG